MEKLKGWAGEYLILKMTQRNVDIMLIVYQNLSGIIIVVICIL